MSELKHGHDKMRLESRLRELEKGLGDLAGNDDFEGLYKVIRQPWWTTPAEFALAMGMVESLLSQINAVAALKQALISGSLAVAPR